jgi:hypothetical protein
MNMDKKLLKGEVNALIFSHLMPSARKHVELGRLYISKYDVKYWKRLGNTNHALFC